MENMLGWKMQIELRALERMESIRRLFRPWFEAHELNMDQFRVFHVDVENENLVIVAGYADEDE